ncbi:MULTISPECIES: YkgJ family cysteine cluster protein [Helicobacter]|uniref:YkgJ family cysteine cluster protein n=1 Tax=Helicobacter TaxID=209 RepID=UPI000EB34238|nr:MULTISPECIES: YkgJ family cysteine cluster protein [Helicobacter]
MNTELQSFKFDPKACASCGARCCKGAGYVFLSVMEIQEIAAFLQMSLDQFGRRYLRRVGHAYSLLERADSQKACVFLDIPSQRCQIYPVRPKQCRTYPFWHNDKTPQERALECPGVVLE